MVCLPPGTPKILKVEHDSIEMEVTAKPPWSDPPVPICAEFRLDVGHITLNRPQRTNSTVQTRVDDYYQVRKEAVNPRFLDYPVLDPKSWLGATV
jgi:hypothetical protein